MPTVSTYRRLSVTLLALAALGMGVAVPSARAARTSDRALETAPAPAWPPAPEPARVRFVKKVESAADWGVSRSLWGRVVDTLTGRRATGFVRPTGVCESGGVLYVADAGAQALVILDGARKKEIRVTRVGERVLVSPVAVAPAADGSVYLADSVLGQVLHYGRGGEWLGGFSHPAMQRPSSLAFDGARGRLYVGDSKAHVVHVFDAQGQHLATLGNLGAAPGQFNSPTHLAVAPDGSLVVTDALNFRVQVLTPDGQPLRSLGRIGDGSGDFAAPKGVAVDRNGYVYAADAMFDAVQVFDESGRLMLGFGSQGAQAGQFWLPNGLYINAQDQLFVADAYNRRVQVFQLLGTPAATPQVQP